MQAHVMHGAGDVRVLIDEADGLVTLTLNGPKLNALDAEFLAEIRHCVTNLQRPRGVLLTGAGRGFSAGVNLDEVLSGGFEYVRLLLRELNDVVLDLFCLPMPVVAALNGHAIAGGCVLSLAADLRIASVGKIGLNEMAIGVPFPPAPLAAAQHVLGSRAPAVIYAAELFSPEGAQELGFVDQVVAEDVLLARATGELERLARIPPTTFAATKLALTASARASMAMADSEVDRMAAEWTSPEMLDRIATVLGR